MMLAEVRHTLTKRLHSIQLDDRTEECDPITIPALPQINPQKVLRIGFQNALGVNPTDAHNKLVKAMENARELQLGAFGLSGLNNNVKLSLYQ